MISRTLRTIAILAALLFLGGGSVDEQYPDAADWASFSDEKVLEYLDNPYSGVRLYAGQEILRRWDEKKIVAECEISWRRGVEILSSGTWPGGGLVLENYLLRGERTQDQREEAAILLARRGCPSSAAYTSPVGGLVRDIWFQEWITRIPQYTFFLGPVDFLCRNRWARERLYRDDPWIDAWGSWRQADGAWRHSWRLREYRAVVALLCGDPVDEAQINAAQFLQVLRACVASGANEVAKGPITSEVPPGVSDALTSSVSIPGLGSITYAELVAVVMNRPDWIPAIHERLKVAERVWLEPIFDPVTGKPVGTKRKVIKEDRRSPMLGFMAAVADKRWDDAKTGLKGYWRKEWPGYNDTVWDQALWYRHPWLAVGVLDKPFATWYGVENKPFTSTVDVAFEKGTWR